MRLVVLLMFSLMVAYLHADRQPIERYQSIIDRQMFGALPPGFDPTKMPSEVTRTSSQKELTQEQEKLQSSIHFSVINVTPDGKTAIGFTDNSDPKAPIHYYLKVGEKRNGWEVKEADATKATMTIVKDSVEVSLTLGGNSAKEVTSTARANTTDENNGATVNKNKITSLRKIRERRQMIDREKFAAEIEAKEAARATQLAAEKAQREAESAEHRQQLQQLREEMRQMREATKGASKTEGSEGDENN